MANEKRLIDADKLMERFRIVAQSGGSVVVHVSDICATIEDEACEESVDAVEVVHARWHKPTPCSQEFCTNCGLTPKTNFGWLPPYCPNCGADMRGEEDGK